MSGLIVELTAQAKQRMRRAVYRSERPKPPPTIVVQTGPTVPASAVRIAAGIAGAVAVLTVAYRGFEVAIGRGDGGLSAAAGVQLAGWMAAGAVVVGVWTAVRPQDPIGPPLVLLIGIGALFGEHQMSWRTVVAAVALLVMMRLAAFVGGTSWYARIELDALAPLLRSTAWIALTVITLGVVTGLATQAVTPDPGMKLLGALAVLMLALWILPRRWLVRDRRA